MKPLFETYKPEELVQTKRIINTPSDFARKALFYVQETGYLKSVKSHFSRRENLNSYLFIIVLSGKGLFSYRDDVYTIRSGDCILINCQELYTHQSDKLSPWELLWVHFNGVGAKDYYQYLTSTLNNKFHTEKIEEYTSLFHQLLEVNQKKEAAWELISSKLLTDLLTLSLVRDPETNPDIDSIHSKLYKIKDYLDQNFTQKVLLTNLSDAFYISKYHLCREYKKLFGTTINDYITAKRITYAKELLRFTQMRIDDIATYSGYPDASYFNKVFQKTEGMTASDFRKKW